MFYVSSVNFKEFEGLVMNIISLVFRKFLEVLLCMLHLHVVQLTVTRLHCQSCDTSIDGQFTGGPFAHLTEEHLDFILTFVRCEGKINRMEQELGLSYPTIRNRLHEVIRTLGFEPGKDEILEISSEKISTFIEDL